MEDPANHGVSGCRFETIATTWDSVFTPLGVKAIYNAES